MEEAASSVLPKFTRPRLYGVVETYMRKRLSGDSQPAFKALKEHREAVASLPRIPYAEGTEPLKQSGGKTPESCDDIEVPL